MLAAPLGCVPSHRLSVALPFRSAERAAAPWILWVAALNACTSFATRAHPQTPPRLPTRRRSLRILRFVSEPARVPTRRAPGLSGTAGLVACGVGEGRGPRARRSRRGVATTPAGARSSVAIRPADRTSTCVDTSSASRRGPSSRRTESRSRTGRASTCVQGRYGARRDGASCSARTRCSFEPDAGSRASVRDSGRRTPIHAGEPRSVRAPRD